MGVNLFPIFKAFFNIGCTIASFAFVIKLIYEYSLNKDVSSLEFKAFHSDENSIYPSVSLCFKENIFKDDAENSLWMRNEESQEEPYYFDGTMTYRYQEFLSGCEISDDSNCNGTWDASFADVDYDDVTLNLVDNLMAETTEFADGSRNFYVYKKFAERMQQVEGKESFHNGYTGGNRVYTSRRTFNQKCLTIDIPFKQGKLVQSHSILLNNKLFVSKRRPKQYGFDVSFHYPNQIMRQTIKKYSWTNVATLLNKTCEEDGIMSLACKLAYWRFSYNMNFDVDLVSVIERRNTGKHPCLEDWKHDTTALKTKISEDIKCQPRHWKLSSNLTICRDKTQMKMAILQEENLGIMPSCNTIERYAFTYSEQPGLLNFAFPPEYFNSTLGIDWKSEEMKEEVVSEITINFAGKNDSFHNFKILLTLFLTGTLSHSTTDLVVF